MERPISLRLCKVYYPRSQGVIWPESARLHSRLALCKLTDFHANLIPILSVSILADGGHYNTMESWGFAPMKIKGPALMHFDTFLYTLLPTWLLLEDDELYILSPIHLGMDWLEKKSLPSMEWTQKVIGTSELRLKWNRNQFAKYKWLMSWHFSRSHLICGTINFQIVSYLGGVHSVGLELFFFVFHSKNIFSASNTFSIVT